MGSISLHTIAGVGLRCNHEEDTVELGGNRGVLHERCVELEAVVEEELDVRAEEQGGRTKDHLARPSALQPR